MTDLVPRTVTELGDDGSPAKHLPASDDYFDRGDILAGDDSTDWSKVLAGEDSRAVAAGSRTLEDSRDSAAYVLLGAPGAGKTELFKAEGRREGCNYVTARRFIAHNIEQLPPEWRDTTLFIDGLDEKRAGSPDRRTALDAIWTRLEALGCPRFRLSCREADWFGANDRYHLETVSRDHKVKVLRLDPLSNEGIRELLTHRPDVDEPDAFMEEARARGIDHLLTNPQNLNMLAKAVASGPWPESRMRTFELACDYFVQETNLEHQIAFRDRPGTSELLAAAGRLFAIQLLTGYDGYGEFGVGDDPEYLGLESVPDNDRTTLQLALRSKLFTPPDEGAIRRIPIHRQVAEFLGARYLAALIDDGLPIRRVLSLMTGEDGGIVSELRGLSAWLAAHCPRTRTVLIERDPDGVAAYGDAGVFTQDEKRWVLESLNPPDPSLDARRFTPLATPDMAPVLGEYLANPVREDQHEDFVVFLLCVLANASPLPELADVLLGLATTEQRSPNSRRWAAICLSEGALAQPAQFEKVVREFLCELREDRVRDEGRSMLGCMLQILYPKFIGPDEVFVYFDEDRERSRYVGDPLCPYDLFWRHDLARESRSQDLAIVLDNLEEVFERSKDWQMMGETPASPLARTAGVLVRKVLGQTDGHDPGRTFRWLKLAGGDGGGNSRTAQAIRGWIEAQPKRYKLLLREGVVQSRPSIHVQDSVRQLKRPLHGARVPSDYGRWCLAEVERFQKDECLAGFWFEEAWYALLHGNGGEGLALEHFEDVAAGNPSLEPMFDRLRCTALDGWLAKMQREKTLRAIERRRAPEKMFTEWRRLFIQQADALRENRCPPGPLNTIAEAYLGHYTDIEGENGRERLLEFLGEDALVEAAMDGLRGAIHREDLPTPEDLLALRIENQRHLLAYPVVAGLELIPPASVSALDDARARAAAAMYLASRPSSPEPVWIRSTFESRPVMAAEEIVRFTTTALRRGERQVTYVDKILDNGGFSAVARIACPKLLRAFPVRAPQHHSNLLKRLLWWGVSNLEPPELESIVVAKLRTKSMTRALRGYWLAAKLVVDEKPDYSALEDFASKHASSIDGVFAFFERSRFQEFLLKRLPSRLLGQLVSLFGAIRRPRVAAHLNPARFRESELVDSLLKALGMRTDDDAILVLAMLGDDQVMESWHPTIRNLQNQQRVRRREADYQRPDVESVLRVLNRQQPANTADLHAVAVATIEEISKEIRHGNADGWKDFWNVDRHECPLMPRPENTCRNTLLDRLQFSLRPIGISVVREGSHAMNTRSDVRFLANGFGVPVEVKSSNNRDLWSAVRNQLIARYTRDPGAGGYGIYLVFWFGNEPNPCQMPESGTRPRNAADLEERLRGNLTPQEARFISICVIDVARP